MDSYVPSQYLGIIQGVLYDTQITTIPTLKEYVSEQTHVSLPLLEGRRRTEHIALSRQIGMFGLRKRFELPLKQIGDEFGGRDHGTVIHACRTIEDYLQYASGKSGKELFTQLDTYKAPETSTKHTYLSDEFIEQNPHLTQYIKQNPNMNITALLDALYNDLRIHKEDSSSTQVPGDDQLLLF